MPRRGADSFLSVLWQRATATPESKAARVAYLDFKHTGGNPRFVNGVRNPNYDPRTAARGAIMAMMIVDRVEDQGDRVLIYKKEPPCRWGQYHLIAKPGSSAALALKEGDRVSYDPVSGGFNFGFFVEPEEGPLP